MLLKDFYRNIIMTEETAVAFLRENHLLDTPQDAAPCHRCGSIMQEKRKRDRGGEYRPILRCPRKGCQTSRSVRRGNSFFHYTDINNKLHCKLSLCEILELVFYFVKEVPASTTSVLTGRSLNTITDWYNMCREVCTAVVSKCMQDEMAEEEDVKPIIIGEGFAVAAESRITKPRIWQERAKLESVKKMKGMNSELFQSHLDHMCWKILRKDAADLFVAFLNDIRIIYR